MFESTGNQAWGSGAALIYPALSQQGDPSSCACCRHGCGHVVMSCV